jgi:hypothetical protein
MTLKEAIEICGAILVSLGGASGIILALSNYIGKLWADRALEKQKQEYTKLNIEFSNQLDIAKRHLQIELDALGHLHKLRTQAEFDKLQELWKTIAALRDAFRGLPRGLVRWTAESSASELNERNRAASLDFIKCFREAQHLLNEQMLSIPKTIADATENLLGTVTMETYIAAMVCPNPDVLERDERKQVFERRNAALNELDGEMTALEVIMRDYIQGKPTQP